MLNTSTEFKQVHDQNSYCISKAHILLKDGTSLPIDNGKISQGGIKFDDGVSSSGRFDIGAAITNKVTLNLNNRYDDFSDYDFTDAVVTVWTGKQLSNRIEWLKKGVYNTDDPTATPSILTLECLDNMSKFDIVYDGGITFPSTLQSIVQYCCSKCGVLLANGQFLNYGYEITNNPFDGSKNVTYRAILSYCALLAGCYARCNTDGGLELKWYNTAAFDDVIDGGVFDKTTATSYQTGDSLDGGNFTTYNSGDTANGGTFSEELPYHHIFSFASLSVSTEDVVITGIKVTAADSEDEDGNKAEGETYLCGAEGYILEVSGNPMIEQGKAKTVAEYLAGRIVGMRFRPFQASAIGDPSWEAGDAAIITDRKGNSYHTYLTNITYSTGGYASINCDAEPAARHSADRYGQIEQIVSDIKKDSQRQLSSYAKYVDQMNQLAINAMGYYETVETQDDGSVINYMHDKPKLSESMTIYKKSIDGFFWSRDGGKTYTFGASKDGNAVMNVIAAIGVSAEWIDTRGLKATDEAGNVTFEIDANTGKVRINVESFSLTGKTIEEISKSANEEVINSVMKDLQEQIDSKIESYNQSTDPSATWTNAVIKQGHTGDYWYWNGITKRWNGEAWVDLPATDKTAQEIAKSKMKVFISQPVPPYDIGDLWVQGNSGEIMKCRTARASGSYSASDWEKASKYTDDSAVDDLDQKLNSTEEIFNRLTGNGKIQGIYMQGGQLYISFNYAKGGTLTLGGSNNLNGLLKVLSSSGQTIGEFGKDGININKGTINGPTIIGAEISGSEIHNADSSFVVSENGTIYSQGEHEVVDAGSGRRYTMIDRIGIKEQKISFSTIMKNGSWSHYVDIAMIEALGIENTGNSFLNIAAKGGVQIGKLDSNGSGASGGLSVDTVNNSVTVYGTLYVHGTKSRAVKTLNHGERALYCYETPTPYFGDIGTGKTDENGVCYISLDDIFSETINIGMEYSVFLQKEGHGDLWIEEKDSAFFVVKGTPELPFSWEVKAVQRNYEYRRLDDLGLEKACSIPEDYDIEEIFDGELSHYDLEMEELEHENLESISGN